LSKNVVNARKNTKVRTTTTTAAKKKAGAAAAEEAEAADKI